MQRLLFVSLSGLTLGIVAATVITSGGCSSTSSSSEPTPTSDAAALEADALHDALIDSKDGSKVGDGPADGDGPSVVDADGPIDAPAACTADLQTDPHHCGRCGHDCFEGACESGVCQARLVIAGRSSISDVIVDGSDFCFSQAGTSAAGFADGSVWRIPIAGGAAAELANGLGQAAALAVDATHVAVSSGGTSAKSYGDSEVRTIAKSGGAAVTLATNTRCPHGITMDATDIYCASDSGSGSGGLKKLQRSGAASPMKVVGGLSPTDVVADATTVYINATQVGQPCGAACYSGVTAYAKGGSATKLVIGAGPAEPSRSVCALAQNDTTIFFEVSEKYVGGAYTNDGAIYSIPKVGGTPVLVTGSLANQQCFSGGLAVDATHVYAILNRTIPSESRIVRVALAGGAPEVVTSPLLEGSKIVRLTLGEGWIAWTETGEPISAYDFPDGRIYLLAKP